MLRRINAFPFGVKRYYTRIYRVCRIAVAATFHLPARRSLGKGGSTAAAMSNANDNFRPARSIIF